MFGKKDTCMFWSSTRADRFLDHWVWCAVHRSSHWARDLVIFSAEQWCRIGLVLPSAGWFSFTSSHGGISWFSNVDGCAKNLLKVSEGVGVLSWSLLPTPLSSLCLAPGSCFCTRMSAVLLAVCMQTHVCPGWVLKELNRGAGGCAVRRREITEPWSAPVLMVRVEGPPHTWSLSRSWWSTEVQSQRAGKVRCEGVLVVKKWCRCQSWPTTVVFYWQCQQQSGWLDLQSV